MSSLFVCLFFVGPRGVFECLEVTWSCVEWKHNRFRSTWRWRSRTMRTYSYLWTLNNCGLYNTNSLHLGCLLGAFTLEFDFTSLPDPSTIHWKWQSLQKFRVPAEVLPSLHTCTVTFVTFTPASLNQSERLHHVRSLNRDNLYFLNTERYLETVGWSDFVQHDSCLRRTQQWNFSIDTFNSF